MSAPGSSAATAIDRPTARVIVLDPDDRVLLLLGVGTSAGNVWFMPGGGLEPGESHEAAARRELWEETSHRADTIGPCVWTRTHAWSTHEGVWYRSIERFHVVRVPAFDPGFARDDDPEIVGIAEHRWWTRAQIAASQELFAPRRLAALLASLLAGEHANAIVDVGI